LKTLIEASSDGVDVFIEGEPGNVDVEETNIAYNSLVYVYGEDATENSNFLADEVLSQAETNPEEVSDQDIIYANILKQSLIDSGLLPEDGTPCDDIDPDTLNDIYTDGICIGICDDEDPNTFDRMINGTCVFTEMNCVNGFGETYDKDIDCSGEAPNLLGFQILTELAGNGGSDYRIKLNLSNNELSNLKEIRENSNYATLDLKNNALIDISGITNLKLIPRISSYYGNLSYHNFVDLSGNPDLQDLTPLNLHNKETIIVDNRYYEKKIAEDSEICIGLKEEYNNRSYYAVLGGGAEPFMVCENGGPITCKNGFESGYGSDIVCTADSLHGGIDPEINGWAPRWELMENAVRDIIIKDANLDNLYGLRNLTTVEGTGSTITGTILVDLSGNNLTNVDELSNLTLIKHTSYYAQLNLSNNQLTDISGLSNLSIAVRDDNEAYASHSPLNLSGNPDLQDLSPLNSADIPYIILEDRNYNIKLDANTKICQNDAFSGPSLKEYICNP